MKKRVVHRSAVHLNKPVRWSVYLTGVGIWTSGFAWLVLHFFFMKQSDFGPRVSPAEPWTLKVHGLFAFASLWMMGLLWGLHVTTAWPVKRRRWSGGILTGILLLLAFSGYLLYYTGGETARNIVSKIHWILGLAIPVLFALHRVKQRRNKLQVSKPVRDVQAV